MAFIRIVARIPSESLDPGDDCVNVWHFDSDQTFEEDADDVADRLTVFYQAVADRMPGIILDTPIKLSVYDLSDPPPRVPALLRDVDVVYSGAGALPEECACVISFQATPVSGQNQRRRRGRIYLGPLTQTCVDDSGNHVVIETSVRQQFANAMAAAMHGPDPGDARLAVFSPTTAGLPEPAGGWSDAQLAAAFNDATSGWVDDTFDTQRRRGPKPATRITFTPS